MRIRHAIWRWHSPMLFVIFLLFFSTVIAQRVQVKGKVVSGVNQTAISGASVVVKSSQKGTTTDETGSFAIEAGANAVLEISSVGFLNQSVSLKGRTNITVQLEIDTKSLDDVVVIGYGTQKKREVTGAIGQVKAKEIERLATGNFQEALQGQIAGVNVVLNGAPGADAEITIRGVGSVVSVDGANQPLYVIDGIPFQGTPNLNPLEIESIEVLKDAASAGIYGTRASNGVILITTKRGKAGDLKMTFDYYYGIQNIIRELPLNNAYEQMYVNHLLLVNGGAITPSQLYDFTLNRPNTGVDYNTDWIDIFTKDNAPIHSFNLRLSGGSKNLTYSVTASHFLQEGVVQNTGSKDASANSMFERTSVRANTRFVKGKFEVLNLINLQRRERNQAGTNLFDNAIRLDPFRKAPNFESDVIEGNPGNNQAGIDVLAANAKTQNINEDYELFAGLNIQYEMLKGLKLAANLGGYYFNATNSVFRPSFTVINPISGQEATARQVSTLTERTTNNSRLTGEFSLNYQRKFKEHDISALLLYSRESFNTKNTSASISDFLTNNTPVLSAGTAFPIVTGTKGEDKFVGQLARVLYSFKGKYLLSMSVRRDGASVFGDEKFAVFPSVSVGYNLSDERFFADNISQDFISSFKIRASYGRLGNQRIPRYAYIPTVEPNVDYLFGTGEQNIIATGVTTRSLANEDLKWETSITQNLGFDIGFMKNRMTLVLDIYNRESKDLLFPVILPPSIGTNTGSYDQLIQNIGNITNKGIEMALGYKFKVNKVNFNINGTFTKNTNLVTKTTTSKQVIFGGQYSGNSDPVTIIKEGYEAGAFFVIPTQGIIKTAKDLAEARTYMPNALLGDLWFVDVNGDGKIDDADRSYYGGGNPAWEAGLNTSAKWKGFELSVSLYGVAGITIFNGAKFRSYDLNRHKDQLYMYSPANTESEIFAKRSLGGSAASSRAWSDYFLEEGDFLRVKNIALSYTFSTKGLSRLGMDRFVIYINSTNPFTFTNYTGFDPEIGGSVLDRGVDRINYPVTRLFRTGITIDF